MSTKSLSLLFSYCQLTRKSAYALLGSIVTLIILFDQLSKYWINQHLQWGESIAIFSWLNFSLQYNTGAAFSLLENMRGWQMYVFIMIALLVCIGGIVWLVQRTQFRTTQVLAMSLLMGGTIGNLIDRLREGRVVDFIDVHLGSWHYATFNIADSAISVGIVILLFSLWKQKRSLR